MMSFRDVASWVVRPLCSRKADRRATVLLFLPSLRPYYLAFTGQVVEGKPMELCHMEQPREMMHWRPKKRLSFFANLLPDSMKKFRPGSASGAALAAADSLGDFAFVSCPKQGFSLLAVLSYSLLIASRSETHGATVRNPAPSTRGEGEGTREGR